MEGIENILRVGKKEQHMTGTNQFANNVEECNGLDKLEGLQSHNNGEIYEKAHSILKTYFDQEEEDTGITPEVAGDGQQFHFGTENNNQQPFAF